MLAIGVRNQTFGLLALLCGMITTLFQQQILATQNVMLAWRPVLESGVVGYNVYYGVESGVYSDQVTVMSGRSAIITGLEEGLTYYFVVTAFTDTGLESAPSNEVSYQVPGVLLRMKQIREWSPLSAFHVTSTGVAPYSWVLEATENFRVWRPLFRGSNSAVNVTVLTANTPQLFFRLKQE